MSEILGLEAQLAVAQAELDGWHQRLDDYNGNNPGKFQRQIRRAADRVGDLERAIAKQVAATP